MDIKTPNKIVANSPATYQKLLHYGQVRLIEGLTPENQYATSYP